MLPSRGRMMCPFQGPWGNEGYRACKDELFTATSGSETIVAEVISGFLAGYCWPATNITAENNIASMAPKMKLAAARTNGRPRFEADGRVAEVIALGCNR